MMCLIILSCVLLFGFPTEDRKGGWCGIALLKSTRADVERLLGPTTELNGRQYKSQDALVNIDYSEGPCSPDSSNGWDVPRGVVINMTVYPLRPLKIEDLKIDHSKYRKFIDPHMPQEYYYLEDYREGIRVAISDGDVKSVEYWPGEKFKQLSCAVINGKK